MAKETTMRTPMEGMYPTPSPTPSGKVVTDGKMTNVDVPTRTTGPNSIPEVTLDNNAGLPGLSK